MERWLYEALLTLSFGGTVSYMEVKHCDYWQVLNGWLKKHNIRVKICPIGYGMRVKYVFTIDGRSKGRLSRILDKMFNEVKW